MAKSGRYTFAAICAVTLGVACRLGYQPDFEGGPDGVSPQRSVTTGSATAGGAAGQASNDPSMGGVAQEVAGGDSSGGSATLGGEPSTGGSNAAGAGGKTSGGAGTGGTAQVGGTTSGGMSAGSGGSGGAPVDACGGCVLGKACIGGVCLPAKRVFITDKTYLPDFGSAAAANSICQTTATTQKFGGTWLAWIADNKFSPATNFKQSADPYVLLDGTIIANNWADLVDGSLAHQIDMNELHGNVGSRETWTGATGDGVAVSDNCNNWKTSQNSILGTNGVSSVADWGWSDIYLQFCDRYVSLYCFEQ